MAEVPIRVLGKVRLDHDRGPESVGGVQAERLLGALVVARGAPVPTAGLTDVLWPDQPDRDPGAALRMVVARVRRRLEAAGLDDPITAADRSYRLSVPQRQIDAARFEQQVVRAQTVADTDLTGAVALLESALAYWQGEPFGELGAEGWAAGATARLIELRHAAEEQLADLELRRGREVLLVPRLRAWAEAAPLRERRWAQLAVALFRIGRQADALRSIDQGRRVLREQLGIEPGLELRQVEQAVLVQDTAALYVDATSHRRAPALTPLIGRQDDVETVTRLLEGNRLVTIHGLAGVGKSSVARSVAARRPDLSLTWTPLDTVTTPDDVWLAVAASLGVIGSDDPDALADTMAFGLGARPTLLVLDGAELSHQAVAELADDLLTRTRDLSILVTSRVGLGASHEVRFALEPLPVGTLDDPGPAQELFLSRAGLSTTQLDVDDRRHVLSVCRRLGGLPIAIELSAATADRSGLATIAADDGPSAAADSVRVAVDWALETLGPDSQQLLNLAARLPGGLSRSSAVALTEVVDVGPALAPLLQARLLHARAGRNEPRYGLHQTVHDLLTDRAAVRADQARDARIVAHLRDLARAAGSPATRSVPEKIAEVEDELVNVRRWLQLSLATEAGLELAVAMARPLGELGLGTEVAAWLRKHLEAVPDVAISNPLLHAEAVLAEASAPGLFSGVTGDVAALEAACRVAEEHRAWALWLTLQGQVAVTLALRGDPDGAQVVIDDPRAAERVAELADPWASYSFQAFVAVPLIVKGRFAEARATLLGLPEKFLALDDSSGAMQTFFLVAWLARASGDTDAAGIDLAHARELGGVPGARAAKALLAAEHAHHAWNTGDPAAVPLLEVAIDELESAGQLRNAANYRRDLAVWRFASKDPIGAAINLQDSMPVLLRSDRMGAGMACARLAAAIAPTRADDGARLAATAAALFGELKDHWAPPSDLAIIASLAETAGADLQPLSDAEVLELVAELATG